MQVLAHPRKGRIHVIVDWPGKTCRTACGRNLKGDCAKTVLRNGASPEEMMASFAYGQPCQRCVKKIGAS